MKLTGLESAVAAGIAADAARVIMNQVAHHFEVGALAWLGEFGPGIKLLAKREQARSAMQRLERQLVGDLGAVGFGRRF